MWVGAAVGLLLHHVGRFWPALAPWVERHLTNGVLAVLGQLFLAALQMLVVPLVLVSLVRGMAGVGNLRQLGRIGGRLLGLFAATTCIAVTVALLIAAAVGPGRKVVAPRSSVPSVPAPPSLYEQLASLIPANPFDAMAQGRMLQVIVLSCLVGVAMVSLGSRAARLRAGLDDLHDLLLTMVFLVMRAAPVGVLALLARTLAIHGSDIVGSLTSYVGAVLLAQGLHVVLVYGSLLTFGARVSPFQFLVRFRDPILTAFCTASSNATLPITLEALQDRVGVSRSVAALAVPLGATIHMDGTAMMQGVAAVFIAQAYGHPLTFWHGVQIVAIATLASVGTAGVPGVGLIMLAMVLQQIGLPVESIALVAGVDRLVDMTRTVVNVLGDGVVATVVARWEGGLNWGSSGLPDHREA